jgi:hypothetical protein
VFRSTTACGARTLAIYTGKVVDGNVIVKGVLLSEGSHVTILVPDDEAPFDLTPDMVAELDESIAQALRQATPVSG